MRSLVLVAASSALLTAACSGGGGLTTGSLSKMLGGGEEKQAATAPAAPQVRNDPTSRAFQVGGVSARAVKCGYNFDPTRLRANYFAFEAGAGTPPDEIAKAEKVYNVAFNGVAKAVAGSPAYCTDQKVAEIKADLTRHLSGDFTPSPPKAAPQEDGGLLSWGSE